MKVPTLNFYINKKTGLIRAASRWGIRGRNKSRIVKENNLVNIGNLCFNQHPYESKKNGSGWDITRTIYGKEVFICNIK